MHPFIQQMIRQVQEAPPSCLVGFRVSPANAAKWDDCARWSLACSCGAVNGQLLAHSLKDCNPKYDGPPLFVSPLAFLCSSCGKTTEIIDTKQHGYESEIGKPLGKSWDSNYRGTGPRQSVPCPGCGESEFSFTTLFGHQHFDLVDDNPELQPHVQEYFDGFDCSGKCTSCGKVSSLANFELA